jgi:hypothetical protein
MPSCLFASTGPATNLFELLAASIGSGLVVGGFAGGAVGFVLSRSRARSEKGAMIGSYGGGFFSLLALALDTLGKYLV